MNRTEKMISVGDRIFARLTMRGKTLVEFMVNKISDMNELFQELRRVLPGVRGLAKLYVRNQSQGWAFEKAIMIQGC